MPLKLLVICSQIVLIEKTSKDQMRQAMRYKNDPGSSVANRSC